MAYLASKNRFWRSKEIYVLKNTKVPKKPEEDEVDESEGTLALTALNELKIKH